MGALGWWEFDIDPVSEFFKQFIFLINLILLKN